MRVVLYLSPSGHQDIAKELKAIFTGNMRRCTYAMLCSGDMYDATSLRKAMKSFKKKPDVVMEIICTRSSQVSLFGRLCSTWINIHITGDIPCIFRISIW